MKKSLGGMGERAIIEAIRKQYRYSWPDDDSAYIDMGSRYLLLTTDSISEKSHIPKGADSSNVGYFFAALNLSDIAAMGGKPEYFMAAMSFPKKMGVETLLQIEKGMRRCLDRYNVKLIGGDLKQSTEMHMTGVALGSVQKSRILKRDNIKRGDLLCVTGRLGKNAAAYYMWKRYGSKRWANMLIDIEPRVKEGMLIAEYGASAAIDLSDGVFSAVVQLMKLSGKGSEIDYSRIPVHREALAVNKRLGISIEDLALNFGGEYELMFTISKRKFNRLRHAAARRGFSISEIGRITGKKCILVKDGVHMEITKKGYEHF